MRNQQFSSCKFFYTRCSPLLFHAAGVSWRAESQGSTGVYAKLCGLGGLCVRWAERALLCVRLPHQHTKRNIKNMWKHVYMNAREGYEKETRNSHDRSLLTHCSSVPSKIVLNPSGELFTKLYAWRSALPWNLELQKTRKRSFELHSLFMLFIYRLDICETTTLTALNIEQIKHAFFLSTGESKLLFSCQGSSTKNAVNPLTFGLACTQVIHSQSATPGRERIPRDCQAKRVTCNTRSIDRRSKRHKVDRSTSGGRKHGRYSICDVFDSVREHELSCFKVRQF